MEQGKEGVRVAVGIQTCQRFAPRMTCLKKQNLGPAVGNIFKKSGQKKKIRPTTPCPVVLTSKGVEKNNCTKAGQRQNTCAEKVVSLRRIRGEADHKTRKSANIRRLREGGGNNGAEKQEKGSVNRKGNAITTWTLVEKNKSHPSTAGMPDQSDNIGGGKQSYFHTSRERKSKNRNSRGVSTKARSSVKGGAKLRSRKMRRVADVGALSRKPHRS